MLADQQCINVCSFIIFHTKVFCRHKALTHCLKSSGFYEIQSRVMIQLSCMIRPCNTVHYCLLYICKCYVYHFKISRIQNVSSILKMTGLI